MKNLFIILLAICGLLYLPTPIKAQTVTYDSSWIENRAGEFYQGRFQKLDNGVEITSVTPIGDTLTTITKFRETFSSEATRYSVDAKAVNDHRRGITEMVRFGEALPAILGGSPLDSLRNGNTDILATNTWELKEGRATGKPLRFRVNGEGRFQYKFDTIANWGNAWYFGGVIRLRNFQGYTTDFFKEGNQWKTVDNRYQIKKVSDTAARSITLPEDEPVAQKSPDVELITGGLVRIGEATYKYNSRKKKWEAQ